MQPVFSSCLREGDADNVDRGGALPFVWSSGPPCGCSDGFTIPYIVGLVMLGPLEPRLEPRWNHEVSALIGWLAVGAASCYWLRRQEGASHDCHATWGGDFLWTLDPLWDLWLSDGKTLWDTENFHGDSLDPEVRVIPVLLAGEDANHYKAKGFEVHRYTTVQ